MSLSDLYTILPFLVVVVWGLVILLADLWIPAGRKGVTALLVAFGLAAALGLTLAQSGQTQVGFNGMAVADGFSVFLNIIFLVAGLAGIAMAYDYLKRMGLARGEYYALMLFSISGMMLMAYAADLIVIFLALELLSIPLYVLAGFASPRPESEEASLKYFLLGSFSSGFVLFGVALIFGATARTDLQGVIAAINAGTANMTLALAGAALLLVGFGFKVAAVPFHMWTPDVYQGAPSPVTGFMSVGAKAAGFAAIVRILVVAFPALAADLAPILWGLAALTMITGNVLAISQGNIKRMLAYSSIAHAGYILMAIVSYGQPEVTSNTIAASLFYLLAYGVTSLGAWAVVVAIEKAEGKGLQLEDYAGLGRKHPLLAAAMLVFMLSFIGVPPTLGFWGKLYLIRTAVEGGQVGLALIALLTSLISAFYYLRVVVYMYMRAGEPEARSEPWVNLVAIGAGAATLLLGFIPGPLFEMASQAVMRLL